jgi:Gas vesicle synthesis protein GvpL/GvpF
MTGERDDLDALRRALETFGRENAQDLVEEARADALDRARSILTTEMTRALLDGTAPYLEGGSPAPPLPREQPAPAARPAAPSPSPSPEGESAIYVYGIASADAGELVGTLASVAGVGASPPYAIERDGLIALASDVPLAEFDEERLRENLNDVEWLEQTARGHELVLEAARASATIVPLRLCTIYRGEDHVRVMLEREQAVFRDALRRLTGKTEWGVKLIAEPGALEQALSEDDSEDAGEVSAGVAYMQSRGREAREREEIDALANSWAAEAHERLAKSAVEALLNPLQNPEVSGHVGEMLLNGVYLVEDAYMDGFTAEVETLIIDFDDRGVSVEMTGPWPPYNFVKGSIEAAR